MVEDEGRTGLPIVGIGASAGGLEAIEAFFSDLPEKTGFAFVVIQHLSPDFKSYMTEILSRKTRFKVVAAEDQLIVEPDTVYMLQPNNNLVVSNGRLIVQYVERSRVPNKPIDLFFHSLSQEKGAEAIGVILSGTGSDGALGVKTIHESGGLVLVEAPEAAAFDGMPEAAIATNSVDYIGEPAELAKWILQNRRRVEPVVQPDSEEVVVPRREILEHIEKRYDVDFSKYKMGTVGRRIDKRMQLLGIKSLADYKRYIEQEPREISELYYQILIGVTQFFRDPDAFSSLETAVLPQMIGSKKDGAELRVWVPGCASGEEAYSLAIVIADFLAQKKRRLNWKIFATDIDDENLARANEGVYAPEALSAVEELHLQRYFARTGNHYQVSPEIRSHIVFARHNLLRDPPFTKLDLVSCRNLLIYFGDDAQRTVLSLIYFALNPNGFLFLGPSESLGRSEPAYNVVNARWKLFSKIKDAWRQIDEQPLPLAPPKRGENRVVTSRLLTERKQRLDINVGLEQLLQAYVPPSFLVSNDLDIVHSFGDAGRFLQVRPGAAELNLRRFVDKRLADVLSVSVKRADSSQEPVAVHGATTAIQGTDVNVDVTVRPLKREDNARTGLLLVTFTESTREPVGLPEAASAVTVSDSSESLATLEQELQLTRESLQTTIEELETTNEELQSTNEELLASNEELQSTNEELHSVNEELYTVNTEHQRKIEELTQMTRDEENLLRATEIGTIFLDSELRIRKYTPAAAKAFHLLPPDVGRPIEHINHTIHHDHLVGLARDVLTSGKPVEKEVESDAGIQYLMRLLPYFADKSVQGVVISFIDVTAMSEAERRLREKNEELEKQRNFLSSLQEAINDGFWDWHVQNDYEYMSPTFWRMLGYSPSEKRHHPSEWQKLIDPADLGAVLGVVERHVETKGEMPYELDVRFRHKDGSWVYVRRRGRVVEWDDEGSPMRMVGTHTNITSLRKMNERHQLVAEGASVGIWDWMDVGRDEQVWTPRLFEVIGYEVGDLEPSYSTLTELIHPDDRDRVTDAIRAHLDRNERLDIEFRLKTKDHGYRWMRGTGRASRDSMSKARRMVGSIQDNHAIRLAQDELKRSNEDLRQFAYAASHDLQAPLRHIGAYTQLLEKSIGDRLEGDERQFMDYVQRGVDHMKALIQGLLKFSRLERESPVHEPVPLDDILRDVERAVREGVPDGSAKVTIGSLPTVMGDRTLLTQLFQNLIDNAVKFRDPSRPLTIEVVAVDHDEGMAVQVRDNGIGIDPAHHAQVFEIFRRLKRISAPGTGIGLAVVKKIVDRLGARIAVESAVGEGAMFSVIFPMGSVPARRPSGQAPMNGAHPPPPGA